MNNVFTSRKSIAVKKIFLAMLLPTLLMNLTTAIASMADAIIIGQYLDDASLSVITFATPIYMIINTVAALFTVGGCIVMSVDLGKGDRRGASRAFSQAMEFLLLAGALLMIAGTFFSRPITGWLGAGEDVFDEVQIYTRIVLLGGPIFVFNIGIAFFVRNDGRPTLSMIGMMTGIVTDIALNFLFVGGMSMGVAGAAYSTVIGQLVGLAINMTHLLSKKSTLRFRPSLDKTVLRIMKNGISSALTFIYQFATMLILNHFVMSLAGTEGVVVYTVVFNLYTVALSVFEGLSQTVQPMIGVFFGESSNRRIRQSLRLAFLATLLLCGTATLLLWLLAGYVPAIFGLGAKSLVAEAALAVRIYAVSMVIMTVNVILTYYLQTIELTSISAWLVSLRCCILFLASVFVLGRSFGLSGIWMSYTVSEALTLLVFLAIGGVRKRRLAKRHIKTDMLFLSTASEESATAFVYRCADGCFDDFCGEVMAHTEAHFGADDGISRGTKKHLACLREAVAEGQEGYIEVEINRATHSVFIRDDLKHADPAIGETAFSDDGCVHEYGPVLGWNRLSLKRGES